ncbi:MAG: MarR family winged helix-turn-helix transcriptional regulator [Candidatus Dormibacterales bacterium]
MTKASQARALEVWECLSRMHSSISAALEKEMPPRAGITLAWYEVLAKLKQAPGEMLRFQNLAHEAGLTESGASRRLEQMLKAGLIERLSCPTDRRGVYAHVTVMGNRAYGKAHAVFVASLDRNLGRQLNGADAEEIHAALSRLGDAQPV